MLFEGRGSPSAGSVIAFEYDFCFGVILLQGHHGLLDALETELFVQYLGRACFVLERSVVLNLLTGVFDFGEAQGRGGALEEMAQRAQLGDVLGLPVITQRVSNRLPCRRRRAWKGVDSSASCRGVEGLTGLHPSS